MSSTTSGLVQRFLQKSLELDEFAPAPIDLITNNQTQATTDNNIGTIKMKKKNKHTATKKNKKQQQRRAVRHSYNNDRDEVDNDGQKEEKEKLILQSQIDSIVSYDSVFSQRSGDSTSATLKRKMKEGKERQKMRRKVLALDDVLEGTTLGNSRSSSSRMNNRKLEPTYNKKRVEAEKELKGLEDLARRLSRGSESKMKKKKEKKTTQKSS